MSMQCFLLQLCYRTESKQEVADQLSYSLTVLSELVLRGLFRRNLLINTFPGPVLMTWGFLLSFFMTMIVAICLAEIAGAYPSTGSVYYWSGQLATPRYVPAVSYFAGLSSWLANVSGNSTTAINCTSLLQTLIQLYGGEEFSTFTAVLVSFLFLGILFLVFPKFIYFV